MYYDYVIVGLGPTGITTALHLMKTNKKLLLLEASDKIGGCWKTDMIDEKYFTENSPKVLSKYGSREFNKLCKYLKIKNNYNIVYDYTIKQSLIFDVFKHLTVTDIIAFIVLIISYLLGLNDRYITVKRWSEHVGISNNGRKFLNIICIILSTTYDKIRIHGLIQFLFKRYEYIMDLSQIKDPNAWLNKALYIFKTASNIDIRFNTQINKITIEHNDVVHIVTNDNDIIRAKEYIFCIPIRRLYNVMNISKYANWFEDLSSFLYYVNQCSYTGIGFQLHFDEALDLPNKWCWSCYNDWKIILLDKSKTTTIFSNDPSIKHVLSCVIVDLDTKSTYINKTVNECDELDDVISEAIRQIYYTNHIHKKPKKVTYSKNIFKSKSFGWESWDTSYSNMGKLPVKGKLSNLYSIGPHNVGEIVLIETAIESAKAFCRDHLKIKNIF